MAPGCGAKLIDYAGEMAKLFRPGFAHDPRWAKVAKVKP